jgi:hypothetical protein
VRVPPIERYYHRLLDFALAAQWGRREVPRCAAQAEVRARAEV